VDYRQNDTVLRGYLAYDDDSANGPGAGVRVWGLNELPKSGPTTAQMGYVALAVDMYLAKAVTGPGRGGNWRAM
jgi:dienelactone hydrolase